MAATEIRFRAMASAVQVLVVDGPDSAGRDARLRLAELEALWSRFAEGSDVDRLNRHPGEVVPVSRATMTLVRTMAEAARATDGRYDPTVLPALMAAGYRASIDDASRITRLAPGEQRGCVGMDDVTLDADALTIALPLGVSIDPGGIGKGLAADLVAEQLVLDGAVGAMVSIGGDLAMAGSPPDASGWLVEVEDPHLPARELARMAVTRGGVATSSTLSRRWERNGASIHHVIDPRTGTQSATDLASVTVIAARAWLAEAHATGALLGGSGDVLSYAERHDLEVLAVDLDGRLLSTGGLAPTLIPPHEVCP